MMTRDEPRRLCGILACALLAVLVLASTTTAAQVNVYVVLDPPQAGQDFAWFGDLVTEFDARIGVGMAEYALIVPDFSSSSFFQHAFSTGLFGTAAEVVDAIGTYEQTGTEQDIDGLLGIMTALSLEPGDFRTLIWLVSDGPRETWAPEVSPTSVIDTAAAFGTPAESTRVNAVIDHGFTDDSGSPIPERALGVYTGIGYYPVAGDPDAVFPRAGWLPAPGSAATQYAEAAIGTMGSAWDISFSNDDSTRSAFRKGFTDVKVAEVGGFGGGGDPQDGVPEPGTIVLVAFGAGLLLVARRRR